MTITQLTARQRKLNELKTQAAFALSKLGMDWLDACNEFDQENPEPFSGPREYHKPSTWSDDKFYWFMTMISIIKQSDILEDFCS